MHSWRFLAAVAAAGVVCSFTDWFFMGVLFHAKYLTFPEVWRRAPGAAGENRANVIASLWNLLTAAGLMSLGVRFHALSYPSALHMAFILWLAIPLPLLVTNALYIKFHPLTVVAHALGWLAKLVVIAVVAVAMLG